MTDTKTSRSRSHQRATAVGALVIAAMLLVGSPTAALAEELVATPPLSTTAPAPDDPASEPALEDTVRESPVTPKELPRTAQTVARKEVPTEASGFNLKYTFGSEVYPYNPHLSYDGAPGPGLGQDVNEWVDAQGRHLQWNYSMPEEGNHTVVFTSQLNDTGTLTDYSVRYTSKVNRSGGSVLVATDCAILYKDAVIDLDTQSPFGCEGGTVQGSSGKVLAGGQVALASWGDITGTVRVSNVDGSAPKISLANGIFGTANQIHRIIMNGKEWYPFDATGAPLSDPKYATISNGESLTWTASTLNSPNKQAEPNTHGQAYFIYEILLDGSSSGYWVKGFAETYKWTARWYPSANCEIYAGDPNKGGLPMTGATPFTCEPTGMTKPNVKSIDDTTFVVQMAHVDTLYKQVEAEQRGVNDACDANADGTCVVTLGAVERVPFDPAIPQANNPKNPTSYVNNAAKEEEINFDFTFSREVTNNFEQMFGVTLGYEQEAGMEGASIKTSIEITSETTFGYDLSNGFEVTQGSTHTIPFWARGAYYYSDVYDVYDSDLYFIGEGDNWYRATGGSIKVPVPSQPAVQSKNGPIVEPAEAGKDISGLVYSCSWLEDSADRIIGKIIHEYDTAHQILPTDRTVENYAGELDDCTVPDSWSQLQESTFKGSEGKLKWEVLQDFLANSD